jgi:hypothetical protein
MDNQLDNKNHTKNVFDDLAKKYARCCKTAEAAKSNYRDLNVTSVEQLEDYFMSICYTEEKGYDPNLKIRRRIVRLLPDYKLVNIYGVRMPSKLVRQIEVRLCPRDCKDWGPNAAYFDDFVGSD